MRNITTFIILSIVFHGVLFGLFFGRTAEHHRPQSAVYEVSIVTPMQLAPTTRPAAGSSAQAASKVPTQSAGFGAIAKEQAIDQKAPSLRPVDLSSRFKPAGSTPESGESPNQSSTSRDAGDTGESTQATASAADIWGNRVRMLIQSQWRPPQGVRLDQNLHATFSLRISRSGQLISKSLVVSSRNAPYDKSIELAMNKIQSFPAPPKIVIGGAVYQDILVTFTPPVEF